MAEWWDNMPRATSRVGKTTNCTKFYPRQHHNRIGYRYTLPNTTLECMYVPLVHKILTGTNFDVQVLGWDTDGTITFNEVICKGNWAENDGGCYYGVGGAIFNNGTEMQGNLANNGACICERNMCHLSLQ